MSHSSSATSIQRKAGRGLKLKSAHKVHEEHTSQKCYDRYKSKACLLAPIHYSAASWKGLRGIQKSLLSEKHDMCWKGTFFNSSVCLSSFTDVLNRRCMSLFIIYFFTYFLQKYPVITQINIVRGNSGHRPQFENCRAGLDWSNTIILHQCHIVCIFKATSLEFLEMIWPDDLMNWSVYQHEMLAWARHQARTFCSFSPREQKLDFQHGNFIGQSGGKGCNCCSILSTLFSKWTNSSCWMFNVCYIITNSTPETLLMHKTAAPLLH